ncbi:MAG: hypothetical protein JKY95_10560 [Planctomycetaceae bacterium]|nr:hypothetical protein [Planctomycetaceae bacterium]
MSRQDPHSVFTTDSLAVAEFVTEWLTKKNVEVELVKHFKQSDGVGLTSLSDSESTTHLEVHVKNAEDVDRIKSLILENQESLIQEAQQLDQKVPEQIAIACDHCEEQVVYPGQMQGTVQECPYCGGYLDVPGGEDEFDWSVVDETISEDELAQQENDEDADAWG